MKKIYFTAVLLFISTVILSQSVKWFNSAGSVYGPQIRDLAVDQAGFVFAIGITNSNMTVNGSLVGLRGGYDVFITKYDPSGNLLWIKTIGGAGNDFGFEVETDASNKLYVSVFTQSSPLFVADSVLPSAVGGILRFDSAGRFEAVLTTGMSVYNMKYYEGALYARSAVNTLFKFDLNGGVIWSKPISGSFASNSILSTVPETSLEITPQGNLIISQSCTGNYAFDGVTVTSGSGSYVVASLIDTNSNLIRHYAWGMNQGSSLRARSAIVDPDQNVYLAVSYPNSYTSPFGSSTIVHLQSGFSSHAILKFDPLATPVWAYNVPCANSTLNFQDLSLDQAGNIAMLGMYGDIRSLGSFNFPVNSDNGNIFTATLSPSGILLSAAGFGSNNATDRGSDLQLLPDGDFVFGGMTNSSTPVNFGCFNSANAGIFVLKYSYDPPPLPAVSFSQIREQRKVYFSSETSNASSLLWEFGDGTTSTQRNPVHTYNTPGNFTVRLIGQNSCGADTATAQVIYKGIQKVLPGKIANSRLQIVMAKGGFPFTAAQMYLKRGAHVLQAETVTVTDSGLVQGNFRLQQEPLGFYDVIVQSGTFADTLRNGIEMESVRDIPLTVQVNGPAIKLVNRFGRFEVSVTNPGNVIHAGVPVIIAIHPDVEIGALSNFVIGDSVINAIRDSAFVHDFIKTRDPDSGDSLWLAMFNIPLIMPQTTEVIEFYMRSTTVGEKMMTAALLMPGYDSVKLQELGVYRVNTSCDFLANPAACLFDAINEIPAASCVTSSINFGCSIGNLANDLGGTRNRRGDKKKYIADIGNFFSDFLAAYTCEVPEQWKEEAWEVAEKATKKLLGDLLGVNAAILAGDIPNVPTSLAGFAVNLPGTCLAFLDELAASQTGEKKPITNWVFKDAASLDPNDKIGPVGFTPANYINGQNSMHYTIRFENVDTATAPASYVEITDTLDANFYDIQSLRFTGFGFADSSYQILNAKGSFVQEIDLRPAKNTLLRFEALLDTITNVITWKFKSLDPVSRDWVPDFNDGFLNPNVTSPEGEGFVTFRIDPLPNRPHLQQVNNSAKIVFDENQPIFTPAWTNTVDKEAPTSQIAALPLITNDTIFGLKWAGLDPHAGIRGYDIVVTVNDTLSYKLLINTPVDSMNVIGRYGNTYKFYSVAIDQVGNREPVPAVPDAVITISAPLPLTLVSFTGNRQNTDAVLNWRTENEVNVSHFELQRSKNGFDFEEAGRVMPGRGLYTFTDAGIFGTESVVFYRLKSVDLDGKFSYSAILRLNRGEQRTLNVFPNPATSSLVVGGLKSGGLLSIFSMDGKLVSKLRVTAQTMMVDVTGWPAGLYTVMYSNGNDIQTLKVLKK